MSTTDFANSKELLEVILGRIKYLIGSNKDKDVCEALHTSASTLSTWRSRSVVPHNYFVAFAFEKDVSLDWLYYGGAHEMALEEEAWKAGEEPGAGRRAITRNEAALELIEECAAALRIIERDQGLTLSDDKFGKIVAMLFEDYYDEALGEQKEGSVIDTAKVIQLARLAS